MADENSYEELERRMAAKLLSSSKGKSVTVTRTRQRRPLPGTKSQREIDARRQAEMPTYVDPWESDD